MMMMITDDDYVDYSGCPCWWLGSDWVLLWHNLSVNCSDNVRSFTAGNGRNPAKILQLGVIDQSEASAKITWSVSTNQRAAFDWTSDTGLNCDPAISDKHFIKWILIVRSSDAIDHPECWVIPTLGREASQTNVRKIILISLETYRSLISWHDFNASHYSGPSLVSHSVMIVGNSPQVTKSMSRLSVTLLLTSSSPHSKSHPSLE